jgi:alpha-beta hydrolase superfamily lysophospholipase
VVIHGYYDHAGLYRHLIRHLIDRGLAVLAFDLPGHGLSSGAPATIESFDEYVDAFDACLLALEDHMPPPWLLLGQSTGGAIAMEWLLARGHDRAARRFASRAAGAAGAAASLAAEPGAYELARRVVGSARGRSPTTPTMPSSSPSCATATRCRRGFCRCSG